MNNLPRFLVVCLIIFSILECKHEEDVQKRREESEALYKKPQETRRTLQEKPYSGTVKSNVLEGDSLERMYDKNYMDYNHHEHNMHDDDEWHDYYND